MIAESLGEDGDDEDGGMDEILHILVFVGSFIAVLALGATLVTFICIRSVSLLCISSVLNLYKYSSSNKIFQNFILGAFEVRFIQKLFHHIPFP